MILTYKLTTGGSQTSRSMDTLGTWNNADETFVIDKVLTGNWYVCMFSPDKTMLKRVIKLKQYSLDKNNAEANKTAGVDTELAKTSIENLIAQTKNEKDRNALIWADKRFKEAATEMQEASAKLASGQNAKIGYEINQIKKSLDKMDLDMKGIKLDNELKRRVMESKVQEAEMSVKALMNSILVGNSQIKLNNQEAEAITDKVMQDWQSVAQQWNKLQQSGQSIEIDRERMENEAKKILNDIVISGKKLTLEQQQQLLEVVLGLGGLATRAATIKGGQ